MIYLLKIIVIVCLLLSGTCLQAQPDSLSRKQSGPLQKTLDNIISSRAWEITYVGVPLVIGGLIIKGEDTHFRSLRNEYLPTFRAHYDDYIQYLPAALMLGLKTCGVESRSSWGRMLVSDAFSTGIMAITINSLKRVANVKRPDGSNHHSFPSGHTATAFMTATMMSKEYGHRSPWYSIGAYSIATATGVSRMVNNKHWLSDVLAGAGFGILSTEVGYFLADLIYKKRGLNYMDEAESFDRWRHPSFFGIYLGLNLTPGHHRLQDGSRLSLSTGSTAGLEGAWFMNPYVGIGGRLGATSISVIRDEQAMDKGISWLSASAGGYFSYPLSSRFLAGAKLLGGYNYFEPDEPEASMIHEKGGPGMVTGASITFLAKHSLGIKFFFDYSLLDSPMLSDKKCLQMMTLGSVATVAF